MPQTEKTQGSVDANFLQALTQRIKHIKQQSYELMHIQPGDRVLDLGCGPGVDTVPLARLVGSGGRVIGIDKNEKMIVQARREAEQAGVTAWVTHEQADAVSLPYEDGYFDACRSSGMFQEVRAPAPILSEMTRVTKPGGWVVVMDVDYGLTFTDTSEMDVALRLSRFMAEEYSTNGYAGRQLYRLFKQQKLADVSAELFGIQFTNYIIARFFGTSDEVESKALEAQLITQEELQRINAHLFQANAEGTFFGGTVLVMVAGRKP